MPEPGRFLISLDGYDLLAGAGAALVTIGLMLAYPPLALVWLGGCLLTYSLVGVRRWASRASKKKLSSDTTENS